MASLQKIKRYFISPRTNVAELNDAQSEIAIGSSPIDFPPDKKSSLSLG